MTNWKDNYAAILSRKSIQTINPDHDVEKFIYNFFQRSPQPEVCRDLFLHGNCYWFAVILKERFRNRLPTIWYDNINNHFYVEMRKVLYDARGAFRPTHQLTIDEYDAFYIWEDYKKFDRLHASRITEQCINFMEDGI